ncbi:hypothetical protein ACE1B6_16095 [Aerosakkonemataceae cyanobacterium BLCC-F154]|uniref:Uncharacterized protein n=1 Tax=Floridaenema fluviatile BLCC-F154 TaxID=3153640 RepID=A0ABV4YE31_9CYAN
MATNQRNARIILMGEDDDAETIIQLDFAPRDVVRTERTISIEPLLDAPIVPVKSAELVEATAQPLTQTNTQTNTQEINFAPLLFAGIMIGSICFAGGYIIGREQSNFNKLEWRR